MVPAAFRDHMTAARSRPTFVAGIVMDDKLVKIEIAWEKLRDTSEVALAEWILRQMRDARDTAH